MMAKIEAIETLLLEPETTLNDPAEVENLLLLEENKIKKLIFKNTTVVFMSNVKNASSWEYESGSRSTMHMHLHNNSILCS